MPIAVTGTIEPDSGRSHDDDAEVRDPARGSGCGQLAARSKQLPAGNQCKHAEEETQPDRGFVTHATLSSGEPHRTTPGACWPVGQ